MQKGLKAYAVRVIRPEARCGSHGTLSVPVVATPSCRVIPLSTPRPTYSRNADLGRGLRPILDIASSSPIGHPLSHFLRAPALHSPDTMLQRCDQPCQRVAAPRCIQITVDWSIWEEVIRQEPTIHFGLVHRNHPVSTSSCISNCLGRFRCHSLYTLPATGTDTGVVAARRLEPRCHLCTSSR